MTAVTHFCDECGPVMVQHRKNAVFLVHRQRSVRSSSLKVNSAARLIKVHLPELDCRDLCLCTSRLYSRRREHIKRLQELGWKKR